MTERRYRSRVNFTGNATLHENKRSQEGRIEQLQPNNTRSIASGFPHAGCSGAPHILGQVARRPTQRSLYAVSHALVTPVDVGTLSPQCFGRSTFVSGTLRTTGSEQTYAESASNSFKFPSICAIASGSA